MWDLLMKYLCPRDFRRGEMEEKMNVQEQENDELQLEEQARERIKQQYYGKKQLLIYDDRFVNFDPDSKNDIVGGEKLTYDEYIDIQMRSPNDKGSLFICAIYTPISDFYGTIARRSKDKKRICFNRIFFTYMYPDGMTADARLCLVCGR